jgi:hypothetical protein
MENSLHERVIAQLEARRGEWRRVADGSKVPYSTIRKIASRYTKNPGVQNLEKLDSFFDEESGTHSQQ